jgi:hypothetical protein
MLHTTSKDEEKSLFLVEIFHIEFFIEKIDLDDHFTMLMLAEICMKGQQERKKEKRRSYVCFKGGLFLEAFSMKPLKPNLQKLSKIYAYQDNTEECANKMKYLHSI